MRHDADEPRHGSKLDSSHSREPSSIPVQADLFALNRLSAAEQVASTLTRLIVTGVLEAGQPLRESSLAAKLGISRNSLREGVRLLEQSRLVRYELHHGAIVSEPNVHDLDDLYTTRLRIECSAAQIQASDEQIDSIRAAYDRLTAATRTGDPREIIDADLDFHLSIVSLHGSSRISSFYQQIVSELVFYFTVLSFVDEEFSSPDEPIVQRHFEIMEALADRRTNDASKLLETHIHSNHLRLSEILTQGDQPGTRS